MRLAILVALLAGSGLAAEPIKLKVNEVKELAPGVFFRYSAISPTDSSVFGGSNHVWVIFKDYVVVIDANFPKEAGDVIEAIRKTTKKPIRYVLDTHHHGDHAWGNAVWVKAGATIIGQRNCFDLLRKTGPADFAAAGKGPMGRKDVAASKLDFPSLIFDDKLVLDDGTQRVEFRYLGHSHTIGDAVAWLPKYGILCTGDACVNGPYNYMGQSDSASWIRCLERMQALPVKLVAPGHGLPMDKHLLVNQKRYFEELRAQVRKGIDAGKEFEDIARSISMPWYKEWTTVNPASDNIRHVYNEFMGLVSPMDFEYDLGILAAPSSSKDTPGWTKPKRIVIPANLSAARLGQLKRAAPEVELIPARTPEEAEKLAADADAVIGFATAEVVKAGKKLRWLHATAEDVTPPLLRVLEKNPLALTDTRRVNGPRVADTTFALLLGLTRNLAGKTKMPPVELRGKKLLLVGLSGSGEEIARRAGSFGMRVVALDDDATEKPDGIVRLGKLSTLDEELPAADVVVLALPLTAKTKHLIGGKQLGLLKNGSFLINAAHSALIDLDALKRVASGEKQIGIGLDTTDLGALPTTDPLRKLANVVLTAHNGKPTVEAGELQWRLLRENTRRFAAGEPLLGVVAR